MVAAALRCSSFEGCEFRLEPREAFGELRPSCPTAMGRHVDRVTAERREFRGDDRAVAPSNARALGAAFVRGGQALGLGGAAKATGSSPTATASAMRESASAST